jgi:hypothetical protein
VGDDGDAESRSHAGPRGASHTVIMSPPVIEAHRGDITAQQVDAAHLSRCLDHSLTRENVSVAWAKTTRPPNESRPAGGKENERVHGRSVDNQDHQSRRHRPG